MWLPGRVYFLVLPPWHFSQKRLSIFVDSRLSSLFPSFFRSSFLSSFLPSFLSCFLPFLFLLTFFLSFHLFLVLPFLFPFIFHHTAEQAFKTWKDQEKQDKKSRRKQRKQKKRTSKTSPPSFLFPPQNHTSPKQRKPQQKSHSFTNTIPTQKGSREGNVMLTCLRQASPPRLLTVHDLAEWGIVRVIKVNT